jgi:hypothetical protein
MQDASAAFRFDPSNIERMFMQDQFVQEGGWYPWWPSRPLFRPDRSTYPYETDITADGRIFIVWSPDFDGWYDLDLPKLVSDLRKAVLLPFCGEYSAWLQRLLGCAEREFFAREAAARERVRRIKQYGESDWASADLLAEVEAVCGPGRKMGEYWFRCPFHEDRSPSLEVNAEKRVWHCWGCGAAGGVVDWRKRV